MLLKIGANVAGVVFVIAALHLLYVNTCLLPAHVRPPMWRRVALVAMAVFYAFFVTCRSQRVVIVGVSVLFMALVQGWFVLGPRS